MDRVVSMRAGLVGCGSIGRRHLDNLLARPDVQSVFVQTGNAACLNGLSLGSAAEIVDDVLEARPDFVVIANETHRHAPVAARCVSAGVPVLVEKPLACSAGDALPMTTAMHERPTALRVGYNMRFLPVVDDALRLLSDGAIGRPLYSRFEVGQDLATWRKGVGPRDSYSADPARGGGAALDLSHEVDLMRYLLGQPEEWATMRANTGVLGIESEEVFEGLYRWLDGLTCSVHADYLEPGRRRSFRIVGESGVMECDFVGRSFYAVDDRGERLFENADDESFDFSRTLAAELDDFIGLIRGGSSKGCSLEDALAVLLLLEAADA